MAKILRLTIDEVLTIRRAMAKLELATRDAFGQTEPLNRGILESAVSRQTTGSGEDYKYNTVEEVGATLFYGIAMNHAFENGNKRTALVCLLILLDKNKYILVDTTEQELYELARKVANHELVETKSPDAEVAAIADWIKIHGRGKILGDKNIQFSELKKLLEERGCTFDAPYKNYIKIRLDGRSVKIGYPTHDFNVGPQTVKDIRKKLHLDEIHGTDSSGFYNLDGKVDEFVNKYRNLLRWLADL